MMPSVTKRRSAPIRLGGSTLGDSRHVCAFFDSEHQEYRTLTPFMGEALQQGERAVYVLEPDAQTRHLERLGQGGVDVRAARKTGQLDVRNSADTYTVDGRFDQDRMLALIQNVLIEGHALGYPVTRLLAHAECVMDTEEGANAFVAYEARLNYVLPQYDDPVICTYDCAKVRASVLIDVLRTHPVAIIGGVLQENPFYVPPDEFLREISERWGQPSGQIR